MDNEEYNILKRKRAYISQRNIVRRIFLITFLFCCLLFIYKLFVVYKSKNLTIEIVNNHLVNKEFLINAVSDYVTTRNFFLLSPRKVSDNLIQSFLLLDTVVARKYLIPENKIIIFVKEKKIWSKLFFSQKKDLNAFQLVTEEGDIVPLVYLNTNLLPQKLLPIYAANHLDKKILILLRNVSEILHKDLKFNSNSFFVTMNSDLVVHSKEGFKIRAGEIDNELVNRISKLKDVIVAIKKRDYIIDYLDLTLEGGAVLKKYPKDNEKINFSLFKRRKS